MSDHLSGFPESTFEWHYAWRQDCVRQGDIDAGDWKFNARCAGARAIVLGVLFAAGASSGAATRPQPAD